MMLEQLESVELPISKYIRLRYKYSLSQTIGQVKILTFLIEIENRYNRISILQLLNSVKKNILNDILYLQHSDVSWKTVSITFPHSRHGTKKDILKLPLLEYNGIVNTSHIDFRDLRVLHIGLRFQGRPLPKSVKIHGILSDEEQGFKQLADSCAMAYKTTFDIENTSTKFKIVFELNESNSDVNKVGVKKTTKNSKQNAVKLNYKKPVKVKVMVPTISYWTIEKY